MIIGGIAVICVGMVFLYLRASLMAGKKAIGTIKKVENGIDYKDKKGKSVVIECTPEQLVTRHIAEFFKFQYQGEIDGCSVYRLL